MTEHEPGDRVRIDIPDTSDPDHHLHGEHGTVQSILEDDVVSVTGRNADSILYTIELEETGEEVDVRGRDVRPPFES
jgi:ribosomal protein L21E